MTQGSGGGGTMTSNEQRFHAAVNVIRGLPKNGSYQPSNDMLLRFYSYFKQATDGPCNVKRPAFWDVVNRAKWDAWNKLGTMSRDDAMNSYVEELKKIIETMSYTDNVANFMGSIGELDGVSVDDLEAVAPDAIKKVRSQPNSPFASREASPVRPAYQNGVNGHHDEDGNSGNFQNGHLTEQSDDEYIDTIDDDDADTISSFQSSHNQFTNTQNLHNSRSKQRTNKGTALTSNGVPGQNSLEVDLRFHHVLTQINLTVERMNLDLQQVTNNVKALEKSLNDLKNSKLSQISNRLSQRPKWWPFDELSPNWVVFIVLWPFVAHKLMQMFSKKRH